MIDGFHFEDFENIEVFRVENSISIDPKKSESKYSSEDDEEQEGALYNMWVKSGDLFHPSKDSNIVKSLMGGCYRILNDNGQISLMRYKRPSEALYLMPSANIQVLVNEINLFWKKKQLFKDNNIAHKRGVLLTGPPGTGKSSLISILSDELVKNDGIVFHISNGNELYLFIDVVHSIIRTIEPDRPMIIIIEDIDSLMSHYESVLSNFLDGEDQVDHCVIIGTTNRIQDLNDIMLRPSRFDWIIEIDYPDAENREYYLKQKGIEGEELTDWVKLTEGLSLAELKELFIAVKLLDNDLDATLAKLKGQSDMVQNTTYKPKSKDGLGFSLNSPTDKSAEENNMGFNFGS